jgi:hypothetical protein
MLLYTLPQQVHTINKVKWNQTKVRRPIRAATVSKAYCYPTACGHTGYHSLGPNGQRAAQKEIDSKNWTAECRKFKWQFVVQCLILFSSYVWSAHHFSIISKLLVWCSNDKVLKKTRGQCTARFFLRTLQGYRGGCSWSPNCLGKRMLASFFNPKKDARINSTWEKWWEMPWLLLNAFNCFNCCSLTWNCIPQKYEDSIYRRVSITSKRHLKNGLPWGGSREDKNNYGHPKMHWACSWAVQWLLKPAMTTLDWLNSIFQVKDTSSELVRRK